MIESLRLIDFRCFESLSVGFDAPTVFFTGDNAQGKTSILEAIAVVSRLGSPRALKQSQTIRQGCSGSGVALQSKGALYKSIYQDRKFELAINGQAVKRSEYLDQSPRIIWMENRDLDLVRGSGEKRRRFLDTLGTQLSKDYAQALKAYTKALRSRNMLLKEKRASDPSFQAFSEILVRHGNTLIDYRARIVKALLPHLASAHTTISNSLESFTMCYKPSTSSFETDLSAVESKDRLLKQTTVGPHRDDFTLLVDGESAVDYASEGQQRTLAIALRLAQGQLMLDKIPPERVIYLIDDVFGELDFNRKNALMDALPDHTQKVLTTTSLEWASGDFQKCVVKERSVLTL